MNEEELSVNKELALGPPYRNIEYHTDTTRARMDDHPVGVTAFAREPGRLPFFFVAKRIMVYNTQNCWLLFNNAKALPTFVPANTYMVFDVLLSRLYYYRDTVDGTLQVWFQG